MLSLRQSCLEIWGHVKNYVGESPLILILSLVACLYLLIVSRTFRRKLLLPIVILVVMVFNPVLYSLIYGNNNLPFVTQYGLRFWRFMWMLPQAILISLAVMDLARRLPRPWMRCGALVLVAGIIIGPGQNIYRSTKVFKPAISGYKISNTAEYVCKTVLEDDPQPLCMFDGAISAQAREYDGHIRQLWGRNGSWNVVWDPEAWEVYNMLISRPRNWEPIFAFAEQRGVTHISFTMEESENGEQMRSVAGQHGYTVFATKGKRSILHRG
jgi:hypothetical protein